MDLSPTNIIYSSLQDKTEFDKIRSNLESIVLLDKIEINNIENLTQDSLPPPQVKYRPGFCLDWLTFHLKHLR